MQLRLTIDSAAVISVLKKYYTPKGKIHLAVLDGMRTVGSIVSKDLSRRYRTTAKQSTRTGITKAAIGHKEWTKGSVVMSIIGVRKNFSSMARAGGWSRKLVVRRPKNIWHLIQDGTGPRTVRSGRYAGMHTGSMPSFNVIRAAHAATERIVLTQMLTRLEKALQRFSV